MDPAFVYLLGGLSAGVIGSFIAARLAGVDRLWALPGKPDPRTLVAPLTQAATLYRATGPSGLITPAATADHPLLALALRQIIEGHSAETIRSTLSHRLSVMHRADQRCQFTGRLLAHLAPVLGITGLAGAMYLALGRLQDPTSSAAGLAIAVMLLMIGGNLVAMFSRRLSKGTPKATIAGQVAGSLIIESACMIRHGYSPQDVECRLLTLLGEQPPQAAAFAQAA